MTKRYLIATCLLLASAMFMLPACKSHAANPSTPAAEEKLPLEFTTYRTPEGWGYDILVDRKIYIHQDFIPAVQGRMGFDSEAHAELAARAIMGKMKNGKKPIISLAELKALGCIPKS